MQTSATFLGKSMTDTVISDPSQLYIFFCWCGNTINKQIHALLHLNQHI